MVLHIVFLANQNPPVGHRETFSIKQVLIIKAALSKPKYAQKTMFLETAKNDQQGK